jgi:glycosyltransferase involved in cell wall biosynthesis
MGKVLFLIESFEYSGLARQMTVLAGGLVRARHEVHACVLGREGPLVSELRRVGVPVEALGWTRLLSLGAVRRLRQTVAAFSPDVLHTWGQPALRATAFLQACRPGRTVASRPLPPANARISYSDRLLLGKSDCVVALGEAEARRILAAGIDPRKVAVVPPAVEVEAGVNKITSPIAERPFLLCVGRMEPWKGYYDALWAFEMLYFVRQDVQLVLVGAGPEKQRLECLSRGLGGRRNIHFLDTGANARGNGRRHAFGRHGRTRAGRVARPARAGRAGTAGRQTRPSTSDTLATGGRRASPPCPRTRTEVGRRTIYAGTTGASL